MASFSLSLGSLLRREESTDNPLTMSDHQILEQIYETHVHSDIKFDVNSLFNLVENILKRSTHIVDGAVQVSINKLTSTVLFLFYFLVCFWFWVLVQFSV